MRGRNPGAFGEVLRNPGGLGCLSVDSPADLLLPQEVAVHQRGSTGPAADGVPIYTALVREWGDVPAQVRQAADECLRTAERAIDFSSLHAGRTSPPSAGWTAWQRVPGPQQH